MKKLVFISLLVILAGCGRHPGDNSNPAPGPASAGRSAATATDSAVPPARGAVSASAADPELPRVAIEASFASADEAVKRSCARALIAYQIGDYQGAVQEFESIADKTGLTAEQKQLVNDALETARKMAATSADSSATPPPNPAAGASGTDTVTPALAAMDPALQESIARAEIAIRIGDYPKAVAELADLAASPGLTNERKRIVQKLLAEVRKNELADMNKTAVPSAKK